MAEMAIALRAQHTGPYYAMADVAFFVHMVLRRRRREARPAATGVEFGVRFKQRLAAPRAGIGARGFLMFIFAGEPPLGRLLAQHGILHRRQFLAPLAVALLDLAGHRLGVGHQVLPAIHETAVSW